MTKLCISICIILAWNNAFAMPDTTENREREAARYIQTTPPADLFIDMAEKVPLQLSEDERDAFEAMLTNNLDIDALTASTQEAMVKHISADELSAPADFYGTSVGKSAMSKFASCMA